jgi:hypothetical protein
VSEWEQDYKELYEQEQRRADHYYDQFMNKCDEYRVIIEKLGKIRLIVDDEEIDETR